MKRVRSESCDQVVPSDGFKMTLRNTYGRNVDQLTEVQERRTYGNLHREW